MINLYNQGQMDAGVSEKGQGFYLCLNGVSNPDGAHHGSLKAPIILRKDDNRPYKIIEDDHVIIIRNKQKYDVTGIKL